MRNLTTNPPENGNRADFEVDVDNAEEFIIPAGRFTAGHRYQIAVQRRGGFSWSTPVQFEIEGFQPMRMSPQGVAMLGNFELTPEYARLRGIGQFDSQGNLIGIYPHYVIRTNVVTGQLESDGGITVGYGFQITQASYNQNAVARAIIDRLAPGAPFVPAHVNFTHRVPGSLPMPIAEARQLLFDTLPRYETPVNNFLYLHGITLAQHQFDVLVSFTYNFGPSTWVLPERQHWYINRLIRNGPPFMPGSTTNPAVGTVRHAFSTFTQNQNRRRAEAEIFINGH